MRIIEIKITILTILTILYEVLPRSLPSLVFRTPLGDQKIKYCTRMASLLVMCTSYFVFVPCLCVFMSLCVRISIPFSPCLCLCVNDHISPCVYVPVCVCMYLRLCTVSFWRNNTFTLF